MISISKDEEFDCLCREVFAVFDTMEPTEQKHILSLCEMHSKADDPVERKRTQKAIRICFRNRKGGW